MEADAAHNRYRSRILREMNANRDNPFNSPPSSTGSHGTVSPTMTSVFSEPDGESTRRLNEDIARIVGPAGGKIQVDLEAAHRKWPEFYGKPKAATADMKQNHPAPRPSGSLRHKDAVSRKAIVQKYLSNMVDDSTEMTWQGSKRTRAEMQPRVEDNESDMSANMSKSPFRFDINADSFKFNPQQQMNRSPLARGHARTTSGNYKSARRSSQAAKADRRKSDFLAPPTHATPKPAPVENPPKNNPTPVTFNTIRSTFPSPVTTDSPAQNGATSRSFFMPDISHLNDFISGNLRFNGAVKNGIPVFVKNGQVRDRIDTQPPNDHAEVDGLAIPDDEERIFVSMDMIRDEILNLQEHDDLVQQHAVELEHQVDHLQKELKRLKGRKSIDSAIGSRTASDPESASEERFQTEKLKLESHVASLQSRLDHVTTRLGANEIENDTISLERDRALKKLQDACVEIGDLMDKLDVQGRELHETQEKLNATLEMTNQRDVFHHEKKTNSIRNIDNKSVQADNEALRQEQETLQQELESLRTDNNSLRREQESLISENRSLRANARSLMSENEELRQSTANAKEDLEAARDEVEALQVELHTMEQEKSTLKEDNDSLVRHNEKYFNENKILRRENSGFERSIHDLHDENMHLKEEIEFLKQQLDHCRPLGKTEDFSMRLDKEMDDGDETEENMTSAFFVPDITIDSTQNSGVVDAPVEGKKVRKPATPGKKAIEIQDTTEQTDRSANEIDNTFQTQQSSVAVEPPSKRRASTSRPQDSNSQQKVSFSLPERSAASSKSKSTKASNTANKGSKRSVSSHTSSKNSHKSNAAPDLDPFQVENDGTIHSQENTQTHSMVIDMKTKSKKESRTVRQETTNTTHNLTSQSQRTPSKSAVKPSQDKSVTIDLITQGGLENTTAEMKGNCPALSPDARRVLDNLAGHSCKNCIVCTRIKAHRGTVTAAELAEGKKRVKISKPVAPSDQYEQLGISSEDATMRPSQPPGNALAKVIKGLEDELEHMRMEHAKMQARYDRHNPALAESKRKQLKVNIDANMNAREVKSAQIYALYDVLEGQKQVGQEMSEKELDMTVFSITGLSVRDITDQITWEGIQS
ncbi:Putative cep57 centrosome microtubule-binding domain, PPC89 centrosome localization [Colletotrichum destructivum]|uniref:Cep57 centrosome microtubule-binding domain, PPC89 centrosome localization n=1 Tax=Colletotrichum destructivum TaxID=34406 RepID=A0AAX4IW03_9PEZI|nr:Putative cep57 centrosome microtubule-binding domain, PPC89 centrosome localization [Colletotrichum destructivum]